MTYSQNPVMTVGRARLEPLSQEHAPDLALASAEGELYTTWYTHIPAPDAVPDEIDRRLGLQARGLMAPWAVVDARTGKAVGMTTYLNLEPTHKRLEIGSTWLARSAQGTGINPGAKLALLTRAFDELECNVVELRTHWHNQQSRAAIARLGAKQDGVLRSHMIMEDGTLRDTVVFSIIAPEWPAVRRALEARLAKYED